ncbi:MAG: class I SAM-dependent methyltransferase [Alphaproteobacteria bacterium]
MAIPHRSGGKRRAATNAARLGIAALQQGAAEEALAHLARAIAGASRDAHVRIAHAMALEANRLMPDAIAGYTVALRLDRRIESAAIKLSAMLKTYGNIDPAPLDDRGLGAALAFDSVDPLPIARIAIAWLKDQGSLAAPVGLGRSDGWAAAATAVVSGSQRKGLADPLLASALRNGINTDPEIELLLTAIRRHLLIDADPATRAQKPVYEFACALVEQGHNNEFVWSVAPEERAALKALPESEHLLHALYGRFPAFAAEIRPRSLATLIARDTTEREFEHTAAADLTFLSAAPAADATSRAVAAQYEANPYPHWLRLSKPHDGAYLDYLRTFFNTEERTRFASPFDVLIAGCGTGEQAVAAGFGYGDQASVTGLDLSRASLGFAARRAAEYALANLDFIHGDILELENLDRQFDVIECVGVLHHMADPLAGWRQLVARLKPGGVMLIGLYSAAARRHISALRARMSDAAPAIAPDTIRAFRTGLLTTAGDDDAELILATPEFYALSSCRDLLFHAHEQPVAIPQIAEWLDTLGLAFHGFALPDARLARFRLEHPDADPARDLDAWTTFEQAYPRTFAAMYQFWCRKPDLCPVIAYETSLGY